MQEATRCAVTIAVHEATRGRKQSRLTAPGLTGRSDTDRLRRRILMTADVAPVRPTTIAGDARMVAGHGGNAELRTRRAPLRRVNFL